MRNTSFCTAGNSDTHQPDVRIWSVVRKDDTNNPSVGKTHSNTRAATDRCTAHVRADFLPAMLLMMAVFPGGADHQRISLRAVHTFHTRIGITSSMITMAAADPMPQSLARNILSYMKLASTCVSH